MSFSSGTFTINSAGQPVVTGTVISSTAFNALTADLATGLSTCLLKDGTQTLTANIPMGAFKLTGLGAGTANGDSIRFQQTLAGVATTKGDILVATAANAVARLGVGTTGQSVIADSAQFSANGIGWGFPALRSSLAGLTMSTAGSSATMTVAAGQATDSTNAAIMTLASAIGKTTSAWAVGTGNGGKMSAAALAAGWYHFYEIMRTDTGVVDVGFDTSATSPTLPTNYTYFRRIGSGKNDGTNWIAFTQDGDYFRLSVSVLDVNTNNPGTSAISATLTVPTGVNVQALVSTMPLGSGSGYYLLASDLSASDEAPGSSNCTAATQINAVASPAGIVQIRTNTSAQIRYRMSVSDGTLTVNIRTYGWLDTRGRNS